MGRSRSFSPRPGEPTMPDPVAFFLTWTTYGTWLPGDERGWVRRGKGFQIADLETKTIAQHRLTESPCALDEEQRMMVERTIREHCQLRQWPLHAVNCRSNHVHVVVSADRKPEDIRDQFKAWSTRRLKDLARSRAQRQSADEDPNKFRQKWWTERGSQRYIEDQAGLDKVIQYVLDGQEPARKQH